MVLFIMLYKAIRAFESVDEILKCDHSNGSHTEQDITMMQFVPQNPVQNEIQEFVRI